MFVRPDLVRGPVSGTGLYPRIFQAATTTKGYLELVAFASMPLGDFCRRAVLQIAEQSS